MENIIVNKFMLIASRKSLMRVMFGICGLSSGLALIFSIIFGISLSITLGLLLSTSIAMISLRVLSSENYYRKLIKKQIRVGFIAGILATAGYDISRAIVVVGLDLKFEPFRTWYIFGELILGQHSDRLYLFLVGFTYHLLNGIAFSIAYCLLLGDRNWKYGVIWAFGLEIVMFLVYPTWLNLGKVIGEFTVVSVIGHACYGLILGLVSQSKLGVLKY
jgi:hypothetical protein